MLSSTPVGNRVFLDTVSLFLCRSPGVCLLSVRLSHVGTEGAHTCKHVRRASCITVFPDPSPAVYRRWPAIPVICSPAANTSRGLMTCLTPSGWLSARDRISSHSSRDTGANYYALIQTRSL